MLLVSTRFALRAPLVVGVNETMIWAGVPFGVRVIGRVGPVNAKSPGLAPEIAIPVIVKAPLPVSATLTGVVTVFPTNTVPKFGSGLGERVMMGTTPVPLKVIACGLLLALSTSDKTALKALFVAGVNVMLSVVDAFGGTSMGSGAVATEKLPGFVPPRLTAVMNKSPVPVFVTVTVVAGEEGTFTC